MTFFDLDDLENQGFSKSVRTGSLFENKTRWQIVNASYVQDSDDKSESRKTFPVFKVQRNLGNGKYGGEQNLFLSSFLKPKYDFKSGKQVRVPADKGQLTLDFADLYNAAATDRQFFELVFQKYGKPIQIKFDRTVKYEQAKWDSDKNRWSKEESFPTSLLIFDLDEVEKPTTPSSSKKE